MQWLAIKYYDDGFYFVQSRVERNMQLSVLLEEGRFINTMVMKVFDSEVSAYEYCVKINNISLMIKKIF